MVTHQVSSTGTQTTGHPGEDRITRSYQGAAWPCLTSVVCPRQSEGSSGHWTSKWFFAHFTLYATNWFAPRTLYQWTNGQEWCIRSPAQIAPKSTLVSQEPEALDEDRWALQNGDVAVSALAEQTWSTGHHVDYPRLKLLIPNPL